MPGLVKLVVCLLLGGALGLMLPIVGGLTCERFAEDPCGCGAWSFLPIWTMPLGVLAGFGVAVYYQLHPRDW